VVSLATIHLFVSPTNEHQGYLSVNSKKIAWDAGAYLSTVIYLIRISALGRFPE
jgi:hypothetical protein